MAEHDLIHDASLLIVENTPIDPDENDYETLQAWDTDCLRTLDAATITATLRILPYRSGPLAGIEMTVDTADGRHLQQFVFGNAEPEVLERIMDEFLDNGAAGLSDEYRTHWSGTYFQETAIALRREGFRVEPSVGGRLGVWLDDHPICEVDQIGGITYRSDNIPTPEHVAAKGKAYVLSLR